MTAYSDRNFMRHLVFRARGVGTLNSSGCGTSSARARPRRFRVAPLRARKAWHNCVQKPTSRSPRCGHMYVSWSCELRTRRGYRSASYSRNMITRLRKIEFRMSQECDDLFCTEIFERYERAKNRHGKQHHRDVYRRGFD